MEGMQSGDEEVQHTSELDEVQTELATASVDLKKTMSGTMRPGLWHGPASPFAFPLFLSMAVTFNTLA